MFFPQHLFVWVSLPCSPECTGRQCRNFTFPEGSVKWHRCNYYYCCYCCCTPREIPKTRFLLCFFNDFSLNAEKCFQIMLARCTTAKREHRLAVGTSRNWCRLVENPSIALPSCLVLDPFKRELVFGRCQAQMLKNTMFFPTTLVCVGLLTLQPWVHRKAM